MNALICRIRDLKNRGTLTFALILIIALIFDLANDRSFGAVMLSILPISLISLICLLAGPFSSKEIRRIAQVNWAIGSILILLITFIFSLLGEEQEKAGELIFSYAVLILAFPLSIIYPVISNWLEPILRDSFILRLICGWTVAIVAGALQWHAISWLRETAIRR